MTFLDLDGPAHVYEWNGAADRTFVCLHAVGGSYAHWLGVGPRLAERGRVIALDLAGFGLTPRGHRGARLESQRALVAKLLEATGPAVLVGSSLGGGIALLQASLEPESVAGIILTGSLLPARLDGRSSEMAFASFVRHRLRSRLRGARRAARSLRGGVDGLIANALRTCAADPDSLDPAIVAASVALARHGRTWDKLRSVPQAGGSTFRLLAHSRAFSQVLGRVSCPVLLLHGRRDQTIPVGFALAAARVHPAWRLHIFEELGHLPHLEDLEAWLAVAERWLDETRDGRFPAVNEPRS